MAKNLIGNFEKMSKLDEGFAKLKVSLETSDWETIEKVAHKLKGSFG